MTVIRKIPPGKLLETVDCYGCNQNIICEEASICLETHCKSEDGTAALLYVYYHPECWEATITYTNKIKNGF